MQPDLDRELRGLFDRNAARELPREPFSSDTRRRIAAMQSRRHVARIFAQIVAIALIAAASPWLIEGSVILSHGLEVLFAQSSYFVDNPVAIGVAALGFAIAYFYRRRRYPTL